jgi:HlyD family secretion protein
MKKGIFITLGVIIVGVIVYFMFSSDKDVTVTSNISKTTVSRSDISIRIEETGEIQPKTTVEIKSKVSGKVARFYVYENDFVRAGQHIADIEPDYNQARTIANIKNELRSSEIRHKDAARKLEEGQTLFENNFISEIDFEKLQDEMEKAILDLEIAQQQYSLIEDIETRGNISRIFSTATGTVIERRIEVGEMVQSSNTSFGDGTVLMRVANLNQMIVKSSVNEVDISKINERQNVNIQIDAFPHDTFTGMISKISASARSENNVKVFPIEIEIFEKDPRLRPGLSANVTIIGETRNDILTIPIRAIFSDATGNDIVYKVVNDSIGPSVHIRTGINDLQKVEILSGLEENDEISLTEPRLSP